MRITFLLVLLYFLALTSCKQNKLHLTKIEGKRVEINNTIEASPDIEAYIKPYRTHIQNDLDSVIAYSADTYTKSDGELNTAIGNFMADAVYQESNPIFKSRTGKEIDMVLLNYGGIRSILSKGNISKRTAFELMPFENSIVVVALKKPQVEDLVSYLSKSKKAHPISQLKLSLNTDYKIIDAKIKGEPITDKVYYVATNDYLYNGGDNMSFFKTNDSLYDLNYKIRNALIDNFIKNDTIQPTQDDRFIQIK
ncbi:5'-nucleotidase C-terminal domain-containing protein [Neotamlana laminarinivorans]|uniref:5'-nucleotidase C-terminal domain-containing protein n=1 Tax=Neotamlana laminarinivorans TaxID=2883124 RepID=A0A9X1HZN6_9FLAO|nr:5'-nucleotidase [Tamlana laminarinivorans]MCB4797477.1 5'-nucleotidase C-terminal domain-containing protein [Tamlana laminarinivorans]